jgi:hypothetical protein
MACMSSIIFGGVQMQRLKFQESGLEAGLGMVKSPFEKVGFRGISSDYIKSPLPPFSKGGLVLLR